MTRNIFIWLLLIYICYQECRAFIPSRIDWTSFSNQQPNHRLNKRTVPKSKDITKREDTQNMDSLSYNDIIQSLRQSWQMPAVYLEKRGYLKNIPKSLISRMRDESNINSDDIALTPKKLKLCCNCPSTGLGCKPCRSLKKKSRSIKHKNTKKQLDDISIDLSPEDRSAPAEPSVTTDHCVTTTQCSPTKEHPIPSAEQEEAATKSPGFFAKIKNVFSHKNKTQIVEEFDPFEELLTESNKSPIKRDNYQKFYEFKYDDSWLHEPDDQESEIYGNLFPGLYKKSTRTGWVPSACDTKNQKVSKQRQLFNQKTFSKDLNYEEIFKNLTQTDIDYVKNFLKCFKENKNKFIIDYLHVNTTTPPIDSMNSTKLSTTTSTVKPSISTSTTKPSTTTPTSTTKTGAANETTSKNMTNNDSIIKNNKLDGVHNVSVVTELETPSNKTNGTVNVPKTVGAKPKPDSEEEIKLDLNVKSNESGEGKCFKTTPKTKTCGCDTDQIHVRKLYPEKIKFLAHIHHQVHEIGRSYPKNLDLKKVQSMIDQARRHLNPVVLGDGDSKNCTPIRLNGLSFDLEVGGPSTSNSSPDSINPLVLSSFEEPWARSADTEWIENDVASQYLSDSFSGSHSNSLHIQPPYSDNFLDQADEADGDSHGQDIDKRNGFLTKLTKKREVARSEDEVLSDISSSLDKFSMLNRPAENYDEDYSDYPSSDKNNNVEEKKNDSVEDYLDDEVIADEEAELFGRKKKKKKKNKKKKKLRLRNDVDPLKLDVSILDPEQKQDEEQEQEIDVKKGKNHQMKKQNDDDDFAFSELKDIKFRVNPEQEEDIQKFIETLNSPPEVFSFDVDKYIKQPENKISEEAHIEVAPHRNFYEFIDTPPIENEHVPYIQPETRSEKEARSSEPKVSDRIQDKRDLLKQYIKGVSNRLQQIDHPLIELEEEGAKVRKEEEKREEESAKQEHIKINNYANTFDALDRNKYKSNIKVEDYDDFVDKFYLLNDGSVSIYQPQPIPKSKYDPENLEIDLDLDKKFRELSLTRKVPFGDEEPTDEKNAENEKTQQEENAVAPENQGFIDSNNFGVPNYLVDTSYSDQSPSKRKVEPAERKDFAENF